MQQLIVGINERIGGWVQETQNGLGRLEDAAERLTNKYRLLLIGALSILYLAATILLAKTKLIWTDEFFTLYLSRLGTRELWTALLTGGDQHPPPFYLMHHLFLRICGEHPWALRLPPILGFLLMMLCVYQFVARRTSPAYGFVAMLMPIATVAHEYAYEARGYSSLLGFLALAVLCWQRAEASWRTATVFGLAAALIGAVSCHYYAVLLLPAIAAAEIVRSLRCKTWNPRVWLAMCAPLLLLVAFLPVIRASSGFGATFWAEVHLREIDRYYKNILGSGVTALVFGLAAAGIYRMFHDQPGKPVSAPNIPVEEIVLAAGLAAAPVAAYLFAKTVTGAFAWRYAIGGVVGIAILFGFFCFKVFRGSAMAAWLIVLATAGFFLLGARTKMKDLVKEQSDLRNLIGWLDSKSNYPEPLIIGDSKTFYALSYYSPPAMKERCVYLADAQRSLKYLHHDTIERSLWALYPWFGVNVKAYGPYVASHHGMDIWSSLNVRWTWLPSALIDDGEKLTVIGRNGSGMLFSIRGAEAGIEH